jgi:hypothetical protein
LRLPLVLLKVGLGLLGLALEQLPMLTAFSLLEFLDLGENQPMLLFLGLQRLQLNLHSTSSIIYVLLNQDQLLGLGVFLLGVKPLLQKLQLVLEQGLLLHLVLMSLKPVSQLLVLSLVLAEFLVHMTQLLFSPKQVLHFFQDGLSLGE